ncbi:hypothetical protein BY996DRAFT_4582168 [Phakopsora pachyrhizi]|nr:hypothetical protein BY996DRAFT_4582168 [Phakopsora pachyrhizi]
MILCRTFQLAGLVVFSINWILSVHCSTPMSDTSWHIPMIGTITPKPGRKSPHLKFLRHQNSSVRLSGTLPSLAIAVTDSNVLAAINPRNGTIVWRFIHDENDPLIEYAIQLDHGRVAVISGSKQFTVRLLNLADGRVFWENSLGESYSDGVHPDLSDGTDILFSSDISSERDSFPDLLVALGGTRVLRLSGQSGENVWQRTFEVSSGRVVRILEQLQPDQVSLLLWSDGIVDDHKAHVETFSSVSGLPRENRPPSPLRCLPEFGYPIILRTDKDAQSYSPTQVIACVNDKGDISSALVPESPTGPLVLSSFTPKDHKHPILEDIGLARLGIFVVKYPSGAASVLRTTPQGKLKLAWNFDQSDPQATYSGSIDRNGLPYVSKLTYADSLGLASLEILSLTPTEYTPEGMVTGQTFAYDRPENGRVVLISVEVLQTKNYVPFSRVLLATDLGTIQLWQGEDLQWERHEDLSSSTAINLYQSKAMGGSILSTIPTDLSNYAAQLAKVTMEFVVSLKTLGRDNVFHQNVDSKIWLIGATTGRLFAISQGVNGLGKILWKRNLLLDGSNSSESPVKWLAISLEGNQLSQIPQVNITLFHENMKRTMKLRLTDGKILKSSTHESQAHDQNLNSNIPFSKKLLASHDGDLGGSPARFLGDRSAIFKYLNPNLSVFFIESFGQQIIEVIDTNSGALIWAFKFRVQIEPKSLVVTLTENWLVIVCREPTNGLTRIHSVEWYMSARPDVMVDGSPVNITDCSKAFLAPFEVQAAGLTKSRLGVTSRALLAITDNSQIISIPRRLLDCRRPLSKPTQIEIEERLIPYDPVIYPDPKTIITGDRQTAKLENLYSFPTEFESTTAVIAVGLDLFATSIAPSRTFDMLGPQFNKAQLILTTSALLVAILLLRPIVKKRQLKQRWYN